MIFSLYENTKTHFYRNLFRSERTEIEFYMENKHLIFIKIKFISGVDFH